MLKKTAVIRDIKESDANLMKRYSYNYKKDASEYRLEYYYSETISGVHRTIIAEYNGKIAGYVNVCIPGSKWHDENGYSSNETYLYDLYVLWTYRRNGIATSLLERAFEIAAECSTKISLSVEVNNIKAEALYQKLGFKNQGEIETANGLEYYLIKDLP